LCGEQADLSILGLLQTPHLLFEELVLVTQGTVLGFELVLTLHKSSGLVSETTVAEGGEIGTLYQLGFGDQSQTVSPDDLAGPLA
jgi:hypothetical protein